MNVRSATPADAAAISDVAEAAWWETYPGVVDADAIRDAVGELYDEAFLEDVLGEREDLLFLVAEGRPAGEPREGERGGGEQSDGEVVGFATAQQTWADEVEIHTVYVHPDRWEAGIGTALLEEIETAARAAGADRLRVGVLSGNHVGRSFFESRGFERVETATAEVGGETVPEDVFEREL